MAGVARPGIPSSTSCSCCCFSACVYACACACVCARVCMYVCVGLSLTSVSSMVVLYFHLLRRDLLSWKGYLLEAWLVFHPSCLPFSTCSTMGLGLKTERCLSDLHACDCGCVPAIVTCRGKNHLLQFVLRFLLTFKGHREPFSSLPDGDRFPG